MKKIFYMLLAVCSALTVFGITPTMASAEEIGEFLNEDGVYQSVSVEDVLAGNDTYKLFDGTQIQFMIGDTVDSISSAQSKDKSAARVTAKYSNTEAPSYTSTVYSIDNADYAGAASLPANTTLFSNRVLNNGTSSNIMFIATPQEESLTNTTYYLYCYTSASKIVQYAKFTGGSTERAINLSSVESNMLFYVGLTNSSSSTKDPYVTVSGAR